MFCSWQIARVKAIAFLVHRSSLSPSRSHIGSKQRRTSRGSARKKQRGAGSIARPSLATFDALREFLYRIFGNFWKKFDAIVTIYDFQYYLDVKISCFPALNRRKTAKNRRANPRDRLRYRGATFKMASRSRDSGGRNFGKSKGFFMNFFR